MAKAQKEPTRTKDGLAKIIEEQREEIMEYLESAGYAIEEKTSTKRRIRFYIEKPHMEGEVPKLPRLIADIRNVYLVSSYGKLRNAYSASTKAIEAIEQGHSEEALQHCIRAERSIGEALGLAQAEKVESVKGRYRAKTRHSETREVRAQAIKLWHDEFDPRLSAERVAEDMVGIIRWKNGESVTHRTIAEWIAAEKKKEGSVPRRVR